MSFERKKSYVTNIKLYLQSETQSFLAVLLLFCQQVRGNLSIYSFSSYRNLRMECAVANAVIEMHRRCLATLIFTI